MVNVVVAGKKSVRYDAMKRYTNTDGKPGRKFKRCRSYSEAQNQLINFQNEIAADLPGDTGPAVHTFFELCDYFEREHLKPAVFTGDRQLSGYRQNLTGLRTYVAHFKEHLGDQDLERISYEDIRRLAETIATTPGKRRSVGQLPKPATLNRKLAVLRRIFNVGVQLRWLTVNPFSLGKRLIEVAAETPRDRILAYDEELRLIAACEGNEKYEYKHPKTGTLVKVEREVNPRAHLKPAIIFAIESGMRKKELFTMTHGQIDLENMVVVLNAKQTKALKKRVIPISDRLESSLRSLFADRIYRPTDLVFSGAKDFDTAFRTACRRAKITDLTFHDLRHTAATKMDEAGISDAARHNIIGHSSHRIAQRYVNTSVDVRAASRVKMNEFQQRLDKRKKEAAAG